jgi:hypothetical protein
MAQVGIEIVRDCYKLIEADYQPSLQEEEEEQPIQLSFTDCDGNPYGYNVLGFTPINICANINSINTGLPPDVEFLEGNITNTEIQNAILNNAGLIERIIRIISTAEVIGELRLTFSNCD